MQTNEKGGEQLLMQAMDGRIRATKLRNCTLNPQGLETLSIKGLSMHPSRMGAVCTEPCKQQRKAVEARA